MIITLKNNERLKYGNFEFKCSIGKGGRVKNKKEGDKKTPKGIYSLGPLYYRCDRNNKPETKLKCITITKTMGWCDDPLSKRSYNKIINIEKNKEIGHEKLFKKDLSYDFLIPINYNTKKPIAGKGSAIFIHLTKDYKKTKGCIALKKKDFLILIKLINNKTKIKID